MHIPSEQLFPLVSSAIRKNAALSGAPLKKVLLQRSAWTAIRDAVMPYEEQFLDYYQSTAEPSQGARASKQSEAASQPRFAAPKVRSPSSLRSSYTAPAPTELAAAEPSIELAASEWETVVLDVSDCPAESQQQSTNSDDACRLRIQPSAAMETAETNAPVYCIKPQSPCLKRKAGRGAYGDVVADASSTSDQVFLSKRCRPDVAGSCHAIITV